MSKPEAQKEPKDPFDGDYIGNIWGWKFSIFGLILILFFGGIILYREMTIGEAFREEQRQLQSDSLRLEGAEMLSDTIK
ncbi:MAG: hypothetical protein KDC44_00395 [Phaeodactylibacter sp.]|nr:hypothetical protein [Phaeodactylibacter sp.]